jgi:hypothetical protein
VVHAGYGFAQERLRLPDFVLADGDFESGSLRNHGVLLGFEFRPTKAWTLTGRYEDCNQNSVELHEITARDARRFESRLRWQRDGSSAELFVRQRQRTNPRASHRDEHTTYGVTLSTGLEDVATVYGSVALLRSDSRTLTNFYFDPDPDPVPTFVGFRGDSRTASAGLRGGAEDVWSWHVDAAWTDTDGSSDVELRDVTAELAVSTWTGGEFGASWRRVDYDESSRAADYQADLLMVFWRQRL